jgi:hypothetical protein
MFKQCCRIARQPHLMSLWFELAILLTAILAFVSGQHSIS